MHYIIIIMVIIIAVIFIITWMIFQLSNQKQLVFCM